MRAPEFLERAGITFRQMDYWARNGYIHPEAAEITAGDVLILSHEQVIEIRALFERGFTKPLIAERFNISTTTLGDVLHHRRAYADGRDHRRTPKNLDTPKSGRARIWGEDECAVAERMGRLVRAGIEVATAAQIARQPDQEIQLGPGVFVRVAVAADVTS